MDSDKIHSKEVSSFEIRCSISCTRAGLAALILATLAISMLFPFRELKPFDALAKYVSRRFSLIDHLEMLEEDQCWKDLVFKNGKESPERWPLTRLIDYKCNKEPTSTHTDLNQRTAYNIRIISQRLTGLETIVNDIERLFDDKLLSLARSYDSMLNRSIYKWQMYRDRLISKVGGSPTGETVNISEFMKKEHGQTITFDKYIAKVGMDKVRAELDKYSAKERVKSLTIEKVKLLAKYESQSLEEIYNLKEKYTNIKIPTLGQRMTFFSGSIFIEFALCFVLIYFWLYQRESKNSVSYPSPGTLFAIFGRRQLDHIILLTLIAYPPIAAVLLADMSRSHVRINWIPAVIITVISILIAYESRNLSKKSIN